MKRRNPNAGLFNGYWLDTNGKRIRRLVRSEYPELYRLWHKHEDIRLGTFKPEQNGHLWYRLTDESWEHCRLIANQRDTYSAAATNTRRWNPQHNLVGVIGEYLYSQLTSQPMHDTVADGGQDFPGVDVKATPRWQQPRLLRLATDPLKAPVYVLVAVDLDTGRARIAGHATRTMIQNAPTHEYGHGPTRTLLEQELLPGLPAQAKAAAA